jgi:hypothetical protein
MLQVWFDGPVRKEPVPNRVVDQSFCMFFDNVRVAPSKARADPAYP